MLFHLVHRHDGEKLVAAGIAAKRRNPQHLPHKRGKRFHVVARNTLQINVPANSAVRVEGMTQRHGPRVKARFAALASPGIDTNRAKKIIDYILTTRPACSVVLTDGADHLETGLSSES